MKGVIFEVKKEGVNVMDKNGCFHYVAGFTDEPVGSEIVFDESPASLPAQRIWRTASMIAASLALLAFVGTLAIHFLTARADRGAPDLLLTSYYVYVDINPSVELILDSEGMVNKVSGLNKDGVNLLGGIPAAGTCRDTLVAILRAAQGQGYDVANKEKSHVLITLIARENEDDYVREMGADIEGFLRAEGFDRVTVGYWDMDSRDRAIHQGLSPGKLKIAEELRELNPLMEINNIEDMRVTDILELVENEKIASGKAPAAESPPNSQANPNPHSGLPPVETERENVVTVYESIPSKTHYDRWWSYGVLCYLSNTASESNGFVAFADNFWDIYEWAAIEFGTSSNNKYTVTFDKTSYTIEGVRHTDYAPSLIPSQWGAHYYDGKGYLGNTLTGCWFDSPFGSKNQQAYALKLKPIGQ
ncbi:MAG: hypothetical protein LBB49_06795 [Gracilibacteraceae bacterium]|jgi:hypothetical protein|nr:hypothetical protein [Gracilibacteraceae bacterium]